MRKTEVMTKLKSNNGITLIALVITIIVLLILAGVAISMLSGENGILKQAANSKLETGKASTDEAVKLAALVGLTAGHGKMNLDVLNEELTEVAGKDINITELPEILTINGKDYIITKDGQGREATGVEKNLGIKITESKATLFDINNEQIVVPVGFKIKSDSPTTVKRGIVVVAPDNSEFVWVPVKDISTMYGTRKVTLEDGTTKEVKSGKLYSFAKNGTEITIKNNNWTETSGVMNWTSATSYREPDYLPSTYAGDASTTENRGLNLLSSIVGIEGVVGTDNEAMLEAWNTQLQNEFDEMIKYVGENKGFYVGRYETSLNTTTKNVQSKSKVYSLKGASANTWYGLYQKQKEYSEKNSLTNIVGSSMIWGSQFDQILLWMNENGIDITSKTPTNLEGVITSRNTTRKTGTVETDKLNNIYDLLGNSYEWTCAADGSTGRVTRGGCDSDSTPLRTLYTGSGPYNILSNTSSRITLYVK